MSPKLRSVPPPGLELSSSVEEVEFRLRWGTIVLAGGVVGVVGISGSFLESRLAFLGSVTHYGDSLKSDIK